MPYIRISITKPRKGQEAHLEEVMRQLGDAIKAAPGCRDSWVLKPHDNSGEIVRISIYEDEAAAEAAANNDHVMALRSEVQFAAEEKGHVERAFFSI